MSKQKIGFSPYTTFRERRKLGCNKVNTESDLRKEQFQLQKIEQQLRQHTTSTGKPNPNPSRCATLRRVNSIGHLHLLNTSGDTTDSGENNTQPSFLSPQASERLLCKYDTREKTIHEETDEEIFLNPVTRQTGERLGSPGQQGSPNWKNQRSMMIPNKDGKQNYTQKSERSLTMMTIIKDTPVKPTQSTRVPRHLDATIKKTVVIVPPPPSYNVKSPQAKETHKTTKSNFHKPGNASAAVPNRSSANKATNKPSAANIQSAMKKTKELAQELSNMKLKYGEEIQLMLANVVKLLGQEST